MKRKQSYFDENGYEIVPEENEQQSNGYPFIVRAIAAVLAVGVFWAAANHITNERVIFANVNGTSMDYSLLNGQHVMIDTWNPPEIAHGRIIAFSANKEDPLNPRIAESTKNGEPINYVKRIVALPGDTIAGKEDGIYLNGEKLEEPYLANKYRPIPIPWTLESLSEGSLWADENGPSVVPDDHVFVLGDNREISEDSRYFGFVHIDSIIGNVDPLPWNEQPMIEEAK